MKPQRRDVLKMMTAAPALGQTTPMGGREKPNIVLIMSDQHRAGFTRRRGFPLDTMPALDRLAARGVAFDRAYTTAPLCVPARVSLLTGRWPHAHRVRQNRAGKVAFFEKDLFEVCKEHGYRIGLTGKNHSHVTAEKFDFYRTYGYGGLDAGPRAEGIRGVPRMDEAPQPRLSRVGHAIPGGDAIPVSHRFQRHRIHARGGEPAVRALGELSRATQSLPGSQAVLRHVSAGGRSAARRRSRGAQEQGLQMAVAARARREHLSGLRRSTGAARGPITSACCG